MSNPQGTKRKATVQQVAQAATAKGRAQLGLAGVPLPPAKQARVTAAAAGPSLSANPCGNEEEGVCGNFSRERAWTVANPVQGLIIQKITRTFNVEILDPTNNWVQVSGAALDGYVQVPGATVNAAEVQYWEVWTVAANGRVSDGNVDTFGLTSLIPNASQHHDTTRGDFTMHGDAHFYATALGPDQLGFATGAIAAAGGLYSRPDNPSGDLAGANLVSASGPVTYEVFATWDSTARSRPQGRGNTGFPYTPRAAWTQVQVT